MFSYSWRHWCWKLRLCFFAIFLAHRGTPSTGHTAHPCTERPIVGILTQPTEGGLQKYGTSQLQAGYVKWVESSGMRAAPIPFDGSPDEVKELFNSVNGILFMGGNTDLIDHRTGYYETAEFLFNLTVAANLHGDYMPLWGTCLGLELLAIIVSQNFTIMGNTYYTSTNVSLPLKFTAEAGSSRMFGSAPQDILDKFSTLNVTDNEHHNAVTPNEFSENPKLPGFFSILSTNTDLNGREFISTMEAKEMPIYAPQWHPERTLFEWYRYQNINHSLAAVECAQYVGRFFAGEARRSCHHFESRERESAALIYNYSPTYTLQITDGSYEQIYFFGS